MSTILSNRVRNHIDAAVREHLFLDDCLKDDAKIYSRGITAICVAGLSGIAYSMVGKYVVDSARDNGVDGVYYDAVRNNLYIIQAKCSIKGTSTLETGELRKFIAGVYDLLNENWDKFSPRLKSISAEISKAIRNDPEVILVAAYNSDNKISSDCEAIIEEFLSENNSDSQEVVSFQSFDLKRILRTIKVIKSGAKSDVEVNLLQWGEQKEPYYAIYGKLSCADVAEWHIAHGDLLFSENIRNTLPDSDINSQIEITLLTKPLDFWYLNNGITAIADDIIRKPIGLGEQRDSSYWKVSNIKIVNGAQTTGSIAKIYAKNPKVVKKAYVQVKIISLENAPIDIPTLITTATNTQNKVEPKDFLALDATQDGISESFKKIGIQYCFRRGEKVVDSSRGLDVQELALALAVSSESMASVTVAKRNAGSLTDPTGYYPKIFNRPISGSDWDLVVKWRTASQAISTLAETLIGREAQLAVHGNRFIEHILVRSTKPINAELVEGVYSALKAAINQLYSECYLAVLFKNTKKCELLKQQLLSRGFS